MLTETLNNFSELLNINSTIIPNIITFIIVAVLLIISMKSALDLKSIVMIYGLTMGILAILGIDSVFNLFTLLELLYNEIIELIF